MIFNKKFDRSLWLLIASGKQGKENIGDLISYLPKEVYRRIQIAIYKYYRGEIHNICDNMIFSESFRSAGGIQYYVCVSIVNNELKLRVRRWVEDRDRVEEDYELNLISISYEDLIKMNTYDRAYIGSYSHEFNNIQFVNNVTSVKTENVDRDYFMTRMICGFKISRYIGKISCGCKYVNVLKYIPKELYYEDFSELENVDKLVKRKVRKK